MTELVSIVMPIYDPDKDLFHTAISSVLQQDYASWELIISDDGDAINLVGQYTDPRIKYFKNPGSRGIFSNLNNAIRHSGGSFIQIFCQDDVMLPDCITQQMQLMKQYPKAIMGFCNYYTNDPGKVLLEENLATMYLPHSYFLNSMFVHGCLPGNLSPVILKKECFLQLGYFDESFRYCGDHEYWIRIAERFGVCYSFKRNMRIRVHDKQASNTLPFTYKLEEATTNFRKLYRLNAIKKSSWTKWVFVNERQGVQFFKAIMKFILKGQFNYFAVLGKLHNDLFNLPLIVLLTLITAGNKIRLVKISDKDCNSQ